MIYEWDLAKERINIRKHGVEFSEAVIVFEDDAALTIEQEFDCEERYLTIGMDATARLLVVAYTYRGENVRIISARQATTYETDQYLG